MISYNGAAPESPGAITETETEAAMELAALGSELDLLFLGVT